MKNLINPLSATQQVPLYKAQHWKGYCNCLKTGQLVIGDVVFDAWASYVVSVKSNTSKAQCVIVIPNTH